MPIKGKYSSRIQRIPEPRRTREKTADRNNVITSGTSHGKVMKSIRITSETILPVHLLTNFM